LEEIKCEGRRVRFESRIAELPNGAKVRVDKVHFPNSVAIVPLFTSDCSIVLLKQYRPAVNEWILEIPAGVIDPGEKPEETARRELEEEAGLKAKELVLAASGYVSPGYSTERMTLFIAVDPQPGIVSREEYEIITKEFRIRLEEALKMIKSNEIIDIKTILGIYIANHYCNNKERNDKMG